MKSTCIATIAILGCASAAPQRMRVRDLEGSMSIDFATPETLPASITTAAPEPVLISEPELSMPAVEESMPEMSLSAPTPETLPEDEVVVEEVLWESLSIPAIYEEIYGSSMSMPESWTPEEAGFLPSETGSGYVEPTPESDDVSGLGDESGESDDVPAASASIASAAVSAACVVAAMALF